jgi:hypothetical protein
MGMRAIPFLVPQVALFVIASALATRDAAGPFGGAALVVSIVPGLAVMTAGGVRAVRGIAGAKPLLLASDAGILVIAAATWIFADRRVVDDPTWLYAATIAAAVVSVVATLLLPAATRSTVERPAYPWAVPLAVVLVDVVAVGNYVRQLSTSEVTSLVPIVGTYVVILAVSDGVSLVAWWWASRWALGIGAASSAGALVAAFLENPESFSAHRSDIAISAIAVAIGVVAVLIGPRLRPAPIAGAATGPAAPPPDRPLSRPAVIWSIVGSILFVPLVFYGLNPMVSDLCWSCVPAAPGQDVLVALLGLAIIAVPVSTLILLLTAGRRRGRWPALILVTASVLGGIALLLAAAGFGRFEFLFVATGALVLVGLGGLAVLVPAIGRRAGTICALAAAAVVVVWFSPASVTSLGFDAGLFVGSVPAGLLFPLALAWEGDRAVRIDAGASPAVASADGAGVDSTSPERNTIRPGGLDTPPGRS